MNRGRISAFDIWLDQAGEEAAVTLSVEVEGDEPMGFRWRFNSITLLPLETNCDALGGTSSMSPELQCRGREITEGYGGRVGLVELVPPKRGGQSADLFAAFAL